MADAETAASRQPIEPPPVSTPPGCAPQPAIPANAVNHNRGWKHYLANIAPQANLE